MYFLLLASCVAVLAGVPMLLPGGGGTPVRADEVVPATNIKDPVFAYLIGLLDGNLYGTIDAEAIEAQMRRSGRPSPIPYRRLRSLTRTADPGGTTAMIHGTFDAPLSLPVPYEILGYNPGRLRATQQVSLREWKLGRFSIDSDGPDGKRQQAVLDDVHLFGVLDGRMVVDIDGWLDRMVGGKIDDTRITGLVLFEYEGERWGMAVGYNRDYKGRSGLLNFRQDKIRFPSPAPLKTSAWRIRRILEGLEPSLRPDSLAAAAAW